MLPNSVDSHSFSHIPFFSSEFSCTVIHSQLQIRGNRRWVSIHSSLESISALDETCRLTMTSYWQMIANMTGAATRFRVNGEMVRWTRLELVETLRLAMNDECANRPFDAHSRQYCEGKLWPVIPGSHLFE